MRSVENEGCPLDSIVKRWFWPLLAALLTLLVTVQVTTLRRESQTWDEAIEIASGYSYLRTGEYRIANDHPPLMRLIAAFPLLWLNPSVPSGSPAWKTPHESDFGQIFLYRNRVPADTMVFAARIPMVIATALLVAVVALWTRRRFGATAGLLCAALFVFDPNIVAHGRYVKNDILVALFCFLSVVAWSEYLAGVRRRWLLAAGTAFGLALVTKFSALFLVPVYPLLWLAARWHRRESLAPARALLAILVVFGMAVPAVAILYAPEWRKVRPATRSYRAAHPEVRRLGDVVQPKTQAVRTFLDLCQRLGCQDHTFAVGLIRFLEHSTGGHPSYLLGNIRETGWWYYFPVAFLVKTPVATLCLIVLATALAVRRWIQSPRGFLRSLRIEWWLLTIPFVILLAIAMTNHVNTGLRLVFPLYPFLFAAVAALVANDAANHAWPPRKALVPVVAALLTIESAAAYPHYTAYFNFAVGGPDAGPRYLLDSNLDWGQDLYRLRDYWVASGRPSLCLDYFGSAPTEYYGLSGDLVPRTWEREKRESANCLAVVSATLLYGLYIGPPDPYVWLRERRPVSKIGYSIYVYDLRRQTPTPAAIGR